MLSDRNVHLRLSKQKLRVAFKMVPISLLAFRLSPFICFEFFINTQQVPYDSTRALSPYLFAIVYKDRKILHMFLFIALLSMHSNYFHTASILFSAWQKHNFLWL